MISHDTKISYPSADLLQEARAASSASGEAIRRQGDVDQRRPSVGKDGKVVPSWDYPLVMTNIAIENGDL